MAHSPTQLSSVAPFQASGGDDPVPWCPYCRTAPVLEMEIGATLMTDTHNRLLGNRALSPETLMMGYGYDPFLSERQQRRGADKQKIPAHPERHIGRPEIEGSEAG